jgi:hypothetical protein
LFVNVEDLSYGSKIKVTAICKFCGSENVIQYCKYLINVNRNDKGYYSCFKCKNIEKENTCIKKYGVKSYSMTDEFRENESKKWKGIMRGDEKRKKTCMERYGVEYYFSTDVMKELNRKWMSSDEFKEKSKNTLIEKYGVDSYSKTDFFKKNITDNKDIIVGKIKKIFMEKYGVEYFSQTEKWKSDYAKNRDSIRDKIISTCMERYGFTNVHMVDSVKRKSANTKIDRGVIISPDLLSMWEIYRRKSINLTNMIREKIYADWDGIDYYDSEYIKDNFNYAFNHKYYPTIDHKISVYYGFANNIPVEEICDISNLCITKRYINSQKNKMIEEDFKLNKLNIKN